MNIRIAIIAGLLVSMSCAVASANGVVLSPNQFTEAQRITLEQKVAKAKVQYPDAFARIRQLKGHQPSVYKRYRSQKPSVVRELRALGPGAGWAMIDAIAFHSLPRGSATNEEWQAVQQGLVAALGELKMADAAPVFQRIFDDPSASEQLVQSAAVAMGRLGGMQQRATLMQALQKPGKKRDGALWGLRHVRAVPIVDAIVPMLQSSSEHTVVLAANALGYQGSSWAWKTGNAGQSAEQMPIRTRCMNALLKAYLPSQSEAREAVTRALTMVEHPQTLSNIDAMIASASNEQDRIALQQLKARLSM